MRKEDYNIQDFLEVRLDWSHTFRIIPSRFPPINFFEDLVDAALMEELFHIESLTNDRLRCEVGNLGLVQKSDRVSGKGSSVIMASFTHISTAAPTRFSKGDFGVYYAAKTLETAIKETIYHREKFLSYTLEPACELTMRVYKSNKLLKTLVDLRRSDHPLYLQIHNPYFYTISQMIGCELQKANAWGMVYSSVRDTQGECVAILRPPAIPLPVTPVKHLKYVWNGQKIHHVYDIGPNILEV